MTAGDGLIQPVKNEDVADDAAIDESKLDFDETSGHDHDGVASKKVNASNMINTPAGTIAATDVQSAIDELDADATLIRNDIDYPTTIKQKAIVDTGEDGGVEGGVFNGDFEHKPPFTAVQTADNWIDGTAAGSATNSKYGWYGYKYTTITEISFDTVENAIKIVTGDATGRGFAASRPPTLIGDLKYGFPVVPSTSYRISGYIKTVNAAADSAFITFETRNEASSGIVTTLTTPKLSGDNDWTYVEMIGEIGAASFRGTIGLNNAVAGNVSEVYFKDIKLEQIDTQTVNTQLDEPVSVSVEGVTTTDNIDQHLETSGQAYALGTTVNEGATHRQTFTPTADRGDGKHLLTKIQALVAAVGTGNWTLAVHDAANNVLASKTIAVGSMSTGDIDFDVPAILDVGTAYHFHIISTVADGTVTTTDANDLETVDYHTQFAKHTESPIVEANGSKLDLTGVKLLTGATITVNTDGSGKYEYDNVLNSYANKYDFIKNLYEVAYNTDWLIANDRSHGLSFADNDNWIIGHNSGANSYVFKFNFEYIAIDIKTHITWQNATNGGIKASYSYDGVIYNTLVDDTNDNTGEIITESIIKGGYKQVYLKFERPTTTGYLVLKGFSIKADLDCQAALPIFSPSSEVSTESEDLTLNPIDISEDGYWQLTRDLTGWTSRTITMLASEALFESQAVSDLTVYIYDSNGTTPWTWDERNGLVPPADRTSGVVIAKFHVGDNQIKSSVSDGSMKANVNLAWKEESLRAAMNRLTELANLHYPIVVEVEDVPAIDLQDQPTGADAETGYTNDVTSLRQTAAATPAIAYTGLLPRENQFSEWLDITVVCSDGDGTLQGKLYTVDGTLVETYADLESNPVLTISNPDYKYSMERLILQISASVETTSTAWSVTDIKWRYQYNGA